MLASGRESVVRSAAARWDLVARIGEVGYYRLQTNSAAVRGQRPPQPEPVSQFTTLWSGVCNVRPPQCRTDFA